MNFRNALLLLIIVFTSFYNANCQKNVESTFLNTICGVNDSLPSYYVPSLVSNGSLCMLIDNQGGQAQKEYFKMIPCIYWEGRRYNLPQAELVPFGHFEHELIINGKGYRTPDTWAQTLDTKNGVVTCRNDYKGLLTVETVVFTHLLYNMIVVKKKIYSKSPDVNSVGLTFKYQFTPPGIENRVPERIRSQCEWNEKSKSIDYQYAIDGSKKIEGVISVFSDKPVTHDIYKQVASLSSQINLDDKNKSAEITYYLLFNDSMDGDDYLFRSAEMQTYVGQSGFEEIFALHKKEWAAYGDESYVRLPDPRLEKVYNTAQYHLRSNATKWSFPVGIFPTHWRGLYFGWDEMFCFQALASSNHLNISKRCPEFRFSLLPVAKYRVSHYGNPGLFGARYSWMDDENGLESAAPGFYRDHVFHISNIALSCWLQYSYSRDSEYLKSIGYPVIKECARFFVSHMVYDNPDGSMFIGKCTDLERLGPAKQNPFMTACGAVYTLETAARASEILKEDMEEAIKWKHIAIKLKESLPAENDRYIPYAGCKERSVASLGGLFPYPLFDAENKLQRNAAYDFLREGRASGNMYPVGNSVCPWYAGWMASALALLGDRTEPVQLLTETAGSAGCFSELFEINEPSVSMHPWFATASGNYIYALNQMLIQCKDDKILIAPAVPDAWKKFSYKLACFGDLVATVSVDKGFITKLILTPGNSTTEIKRILIIPKRYLDKSTIRKLNSSVIMNDSICRMSIVFKGEFKVK